MTPPPGLFASGNRSVRTVSIQVSVTYPSTLQTTLTETLKSPGHQSNPSSRQRDRALVTFQNAANVFSARDPNVALLSMKYSSVLFRHRAAPRVRAALAGVVHDRQPAAGQKRHNTGAGCQTSSRTTREGCASGHVAATPPISVMNLRRTLPEMPRCEGRGQEGGGEKQRSGAPLDFGLGRTASSASTASSTYQPRHSSFATPAMPKARCPRGHSTPLNSPPVCRRRCKPSMGTTKPHSSSGRTRASSYRPASSITCQRVSYAVEPRRGASAANEPLT